MIQFEDRLTGNKIYTHIPLIGRALCKNNCIKYKGELNPLAWLRDVCLARKYEWGHIPVLGVINHVMLPHFVNITGKNSIELPYREILSSKVVLNPCDETYNQLSLVYGVDKSDILDLQEYCLEVFSQFWFGVELEHPILDKVCDIDLK
jgi:hypothetical protein